MSKNLSHKKAKSAFYVKEPYPVRAKRATSAFSCIQLQRLESPVISLSRSKQKALQGRELEVSCDSEQAASAFKSIIDSRMHVASKRVFLVLCRYLVVGQMSFRRQSLERFPYLFSVRLASFRSLS
ncbi:hypothetical protein BWGOE8_50760 [Bacillus mycoides]|uniref:Uncharacterized protein n=1 Tax=Bacillus mycoides TaxID=1405 RepID=A0A1E8B032_BACMY|nr:hypothetical protein BWGOE9_51810 [Bacillus mycoides]OFD71806.1 hypothetical protein BWGOE8_50760 [Bacillus mycoides]OFD74759.1 hypothetical protein BWGOE10_51380 [Bacillus mycoides]